MSLYNIIDSTRNSFWIEGCRGYTKDRNLAEEFTLDEASAICDSPHSDCYISHSDSEWVLVEDYLEVPLGLWLVKLDNSKNPDANPYHVIEREENLSIIGNHFAFDKNRVLAYKPFGENL